MRLRSPLFMAFCAAWLLLYNAAAMSASASTFVGGTGSFTLVSPPAFCTNVHPTGCPTAPGTAYANYRNNLNTSVLAIVLWIVHNGVGQTVGIGAATIQLSPGANATAEIIIYELAPGTYTSVVFAIATSGVAVSNATSLAFTMSQ
jgi:hypothetical protein